MQRQEKLEQKQSHPSFSIMPLKREAFDRPPDPVGLEGKVSFLKKLYKGKEPIYGDILVVKLDEKKQPVKDEKGKPVYQCREEYKQQICQLFAELQSIVEKQRKSDDEEKKVGAEEKKPDEAVVYLSIECALFPDHLFGLSLSSEDFSDIKKELEDWIYLLTTEINCDPKAIKELFEKREIKLEEKALAQQVLVEKKKAAKYEVLKKGTVNLVLPEMRVCDFGIKTKVARAKAMLMGGTTIQDVWCDLRSIFVDKFIERQKKLGGVSENLESHVDGVLLSHGYSWGLRTALDVKDSVEHLTTVTPLVKTILTNDFLSYYDLRLMAKTFASHFQKTFWQNYQLSWTLYKPEEKEKKTEAIFTDWFPYHAEIGACAEDILKLWKIDISPYDLFEKKYTPDGVEKKEDKEHKDTALEEKQPNFYKLSPIFVEQIFLKYCQTSKKYVDPNEWIEEKDVFKNYRLMRARSPACADLAWVEKETRTYIEGFGDQVAIDVVPFDQLPPDEKMRFWIYATINFGRPDPFKWLTPSSKFSDVIKEEQDIIDFAKALAEQNQFERHEVLLRSLLKEAPHRLATILMAVNEQEVGRESDKVGEKAKRILDVINISYLWTHDSDYPWVRLKKEEDIYNEIKQDSILDEPLRRFISSKNQIPLAQFLGQKLKIHQERLAAFQRKYGESKSTAPLPIPYSILLKNADSTTADQFVYRLYLRHHFTDAFRNLRKDKEANFAKAFKLEHEKFLKEKKLSGLEQEYYLILKDGNVEKFKKLNVQICDMTPRLSFRNIHHDILKNLFSMAAEDCAAGRSLENSSLLYWAASCNQLDMIRTLLAADEKVDRQNNNGTTALQTAIFYGFTDAVKLLLEAGADINLKNKLGCDALWHAVATGNLDIAQLLLEHGANVESQDNNGNVFLDYAILKAKNIELVRLLLQYHARVNVFRGINKPIWAVALMGDADIAQLLIEHGANVNIIESGKTTLYIAAEQGHTKMVRILLAARANPVAIYDNKTPAAVAKTPFIRQLIIAAELKNKNTWLDKKPFAEGYFLVQPNPPVFQDGTWQGWFEDKDGNIVAYEDLETKIKMLYHIFCTVNFTLPDHFNVLSPTATISSLFLKRSRCKNLQEP